MILHKWKRTQCKTNVDGGNIALIMKWWSWRNSTDVGWLISGFYKVNDLNEMKWTGSTPYRTDILVTSFPDTSFGTTQKMGMGEGGQNKT